jgi:WD40 repeat protein
VHIDPRTATPSRTVAFSSDERTLAEANYLGFVTLRDAVDGTIRKRFLAQTALVETLRYLPGDRTLMLVGAGFEGGRDFGAVKLIDVESGARLAELSGHRDDATDVISLYGVGRRRVVSVGLDRRVIVHDLDDPSRNWTWDAYEDYLNTAAARPGHEAELAVAGDSPFTYVLDVDRRVVVARIDTPGDCNGLLWSDDGRHLMVGDDHGRLLYFDAEANYRLVGEAKIGGAAKRVVADPLEPGRALVAAYDGRVWSVGRAPGAAAPRVAVERRHGLWGINVAATRERIAVPSFFDRSYLLARNDDGTGGRDVGDAPAPTFGCNWVAIAPDGESIAIAHDDGRLRIRHAETGRLLRTLGPDTESLYMGTAYHPRLPLIATVDFHGEVFVYDLRDGRLVHREVMGFGPGITLDFSPSGRSLAVGGYAFRGRLMTLDDDGHVVRTDALDGPNRGVLKSVAFAGEDVLLAASGDGKLVVHRRQGERFVASQVIRGTPNMELCNGVCASPDGKIAYIVARDQTLRAFEIESGKALGTGVAHVRGVKTVAASEDGEWVATGAYDRTVMIWSARDLSVRLPPFRLANSGISGVRIARGRVFSCSFDGVVAALDARTGRLLWNKTSVDAAEGR